MRQAIVESIASPAILGDPPSACLQCASSVRPVCLQSSSPPPRAGSASPTLRFSFGSRSILLRLSLDGPGCPTPVRAEGLRNARPGKGCPATPIDEWRCGPVQYFASGRLDGAGARRPGERTFSSCPAKLCRASSPSAWLRRIRLPRHLPGRRAPATSRRFGPPRRSQSAQGSMVPGRVAPDDGMKSIPTAPRIRPRAPAGARRLSPDPRTSPG